MAQIAQEMAALLRRDLQRLVQEIEAFPDEVNLWQTRPGVTNSAGHLAMHLEGNLREYIGRLLGGIAYTRQRDLEFSGPPVPVGDLVARLSNVRDTIPGVVAGLTDETLAAPFPEPVLSTPMTTGQLLIHLLGHLNYHLGQIDYLRRILNQGHAITFATL